MLPQSYRSHADLQHAVFGQSHVHMGQTMTDDTPDFTQLDDSALISRRAQMRAELDRLPPHSAGHDALLRRLNRRDQRTRPRGADTSELKPDERYGRHRRPSRQSSTHAGSGDTPRRT